MRKIAIFGASGYLGKCIVRAAMNKGVAVVAFVRDIERFQQGEFADVETRSVCFNSDSPLRGKLDDCYAIISTLGITKQKDGLSYDEVDYKINARILREAEITDIERFMFVSVYKGDTFKDVALCKAKERFVRELCDSTVPSVIIRPTGFYSDMLDFLKMAKSGKVHLFGSGEQKLNPISGDDLAIEMLKILQNDRGFKSNQSINIGGPKTFSHHQIAKLAFLALKRPIKIKTHPDWLRKLSLLLGRFFIPKKLFGPYEFFLTAMGEDMNTDEYGTQSLYVFFKQEALRLENRT
ncbi:MAG: NAD(P)H-binding protein [Paraglaciecola sp.]|uniref:NAD(P)H-binding protein n=1 Tax=Paraglaciecola sp. TaxID=1920173 RepID=UPI0032993C8C